MLSLQATIWYLLLTGCYRVVTGYYLLLTTYQVLCREGAAHELPWQPLIEHSTRSLGRVGSNNFSRFGGSGAGADAGASAGANTGASAAGGGTDGQLVCLMIPTSEAKLHPLKADVTQQVLRLLRSY